VLSEDVENNAIRTTCRDNELVMYLYNEVYIIKYV